MRTVTPSSRTARVVYSRWPLRVKVICIIVPERFLRHPPHSTSPTEADAAPEAHAGTCRATQARLTPVLRRVIYPSRAEPFLPGYRSLQPLPELMARCRGRGVK